MKYALFILLPLLAGCTNYEYDLAQPTNFATHVSKSADAVVNRDPLEYRLRTVDNRLVVRIYNSTSDQITLLGAQSSVVDPGGQSHSLRTATIAPNSFIKLIIPPIRPTVRQDGPTFGIGIGTVVGDARSPRDIGPYDDSPAANRPRYLSVVDESDSYYWDWNGAGEIRLTLVFDRDGKSFSHDFTIDRKKM